MSLAYQITVVNVRQWANMSLHLHPNMLASMLRRCQKPRQRLPDFLELYRTEFVDDTCVKMLMKHSPMNTPPRRIWHQAHIEIPAGPCTRELVAAVSSKNGSRLQLRHNRRIAIGVDMRPLLEKVHCSLS